MTVIIGVPPLFDLIDAEFHVAGKNILYSWGTSIYNPSGKPIPPELLAHETAHGLRQTNHRPDIEKWWHRYIADIEFRLVEEIEGHRAEFKKFCHLNKDRNTQAVGLHRMAIRLSSSLYGGIITAAAARMAIAD